jgi:hypothetical protein
LVSRAAFDRRQVARVAWHGQIQSNAAAFAEYHGALDHVLQLAPLVPDLDVTKRCSDLYSAATKRYRTRSSIIPGRFDRNGSILLFKLLNIFF